MHQVTLKYTVVSTVPTRVPTPPELVFASADWQTIATALPSPESLATRDIGETVTDHRSSWVRKASANGQDLFVKTYDYPSWRDRLRNWGKWTAPIRRSRAAREVEALLWLSDHGFATARPLACLEWRSCGFLARATLVTAAFAGEVAVQNLAAASPARRTEVAGAIGAFVARLHAAGFRDRNLDLRNLLVRTGGDEIAIAKIDSPRFCLVTPGRCDDALADADWQRLLPQLAEFELAETAAAHRRQ